MLAETFEADPDFADAAGRPLEEARTAGHAMQISDSGAVAGGDGTLRGAYVAGRDLHIDGDGSA